MTLFIFGLRLRNPGRRRKGIKWEKFQIDTLDFSGNPLPLFLSNGSQTEFEKLSLPEG